MSPQTLPCHDIAHKTRQRPRGSVQHLTLARWLSESPGLPLAVTLALAFATKRMTKHNLLVRVFESCESKRSLFAKSSADDGTAMSNANVIVTDKTGTLTKNAMTVAAILLTGTIYTDTDLQKKQVGSDATDLQAEKKELSALGDDVKGGLQTLLCSSIAVNSNAYQDTDEYGESKWVGSKTDIALLQLAERLDWGDYHELRENADVVRLWPFSSDRKAMASLIKHGDKHRLIVKGAAEVLIKACTRRVDIASDKDDLTSCDLDDKAREALSNVVTALAQASLRTIALCYRDFDSAPSKNASYEEVAKDLVLLAVAGLEDPLRETVSQSVADCHHAHLDVIMCTGDSLLTAKAIAAQCGILKEGDEALDAKDFRDLGKEKQRELAPRLKVLARSLPKDKDDLVAVLQDLGKIVGVTGDGTNDSLALKRANVGFSMASGTEVAKEASEIVLMDDNVRPSIVSLYNSLTLLSVCKHRVCHYLGKMRFRCSPQIPSIPARRQYHCNNYHLRLSRLGRRREQHSEPRTVALGESDHGHICRLG